MRRPVAKPVIDWSPMRDELEALLDEYGSEDFHEDRIYKIEANLVETALEVLYGPNVFDWINEKLK